VGEQQRGVGGERAQHLRRGTVTELVEAAAQRLAIQRDAALSRCGARRLQQGGMVAEGILHPDWVEPLENVADGGVRRRPLPCQTKRCVQLAPVDVDEGDNAAIRVTAGHDGQDGEQRHIGQLVELPLRPARIRDVRQHIQQRRKHSHGNLHPSCRRRSQTLPGSGTPLRSAAYFAPCMHQGGLSAAHPAALNSPPALPPSRPSRSRTGPQVQ